MWINEEVEFRKKKEREFYFTLARLWCRHMAATLKLSLGGYYMLYLG